MPNRRAIRRARPQRTPADVAFADLLALSAGMPVVTAGRYVAAGSNVESLVDWNDPTHLFTQPAPANQCPLPTQQASFNGRPCLSFVKASLQYYSSNRSLAYWRLLGDGTPYSLYVVYAVTSTVGVNILAATGQGVGGVANAYYTNGSLQVWYAASGNRSGGTVTATVPSYAVYGRTTGFVEMYQKSTQLVAPSTVVGNSALDPPMSLRIGATGPTIDNYANMLFAGLYMFPYFNDSAKRARVETAFQTIYGIAP